MLISDANNNRKAPNYLATLNVKSVQSNNLQNLGILTKFMNADQSLEC